MTGCTRAASQAAVSSIAVAAALGAALAVPGAAIAGPGDAAPGAPPEPLDLAALAKASKTVAIAEDRLRAALVKGAPEGVEFSAVLDLGGGASAVAWSECDQASCRGSVATLTGGAEQPRLARRAALVAPAKVSFDGGFSLEPPAFTDLDGDGTPEIVVTYKTTEWPRAALGSTTRAYVVAYAAKDLSVVFARELRRTGGEGEEAQAWTLSRSGDRLIAQGQVNTRVCLETTPTPADCKPTRTLVETWRKAPGQKRYAKIANAK